MSDVDAVVIGSGPNGLAAANRLVDAGWSVLLLEAESDAGGAVRSAELTRPGFSHDRFSSFYPLAAASSVIQAMHLEEHGLRWVHAPDVLAHPFLDGRTALLSRDIDKTAASLDTFAAGDGDAWRELYGLWDRIGDDVVASLLSPFPPVKGAGRVALHLGWRDLLPFARFLMLPARRLCEETWSGEGGPLLLAGNTLHTDLAPEHVLGGFFGWMLMSLGQQHGFPVPEGGSGALTQAMARRFQANGGQLRCGAPVARVVVRGGRAVGVETAEGEPIGARRGVLADVGAPALYMRLVGPEHLPSSVVKAVDKFVYDHATVKVDWALSRPIPWTAPDTARAGTVHVGENVDELSRLSYQLAVGAVPDRPFLLLGQMTTTDPTRSPAGTETAWAYTHVPQTVRSDPLDQVKGVWDEHDAETFADRMEEQVERFAPGFRDCILDRHILTPRSLEADDANLVGGAVNGGTAQLFQQLVFRPVPGLGRAETSVPGLYLASASAHPGGGVHGACGANAARAALWHDRVGRARNLLGRRTSRA